jgi:RNA polymerase sigma-70 factor (sigma-E family)
MSARKPDRPPARQEKVTEALVADTAMLGEVTPHASLDAADARAAGGVCPEHGLGCRHDAAPGARLGHTVEEKTVRIDRTVGLDQLVGAGADADAADAAITLLYGSHYRSLVRLATLLVHDIATAEEVVQDSFVALHAGLHRLRDSEKALSYLRAAVLNRARSVLRHRVVVDSNAPKPVPDMPSAELGALALLERSSVVAALRSLPVRQREVVVLRFYGDLSEAQIAAAMGITRGAVKSHTARAMAALRSVLEPEA